MMRVSPSYGCEQVRWPRAQYTMMAGAVAGALEGTNHSKVRVQLLSLAPGTNC